MFREKKRAESAAENIFDVKLHQRQEGDIWVKAAAPGVRMMNMTRSSRAPHERHDQHTLSLYISVCDVRPPETMMARVE